MNLNLSKTFKDTRDRSWTIVITWGTARRVRDAGAFDLNALIRDPEVKKEKPTQEEAQQLLDPYLKLVADPYRLLEVVGLILQPDVEKAGITMQEFFEGIAGETLVGARDAFTQALADFFQNQPLKQQLLVGAATMGKKTEAAMALAMRRTEKEFQKIESLDVEALAEQALATALKNSSTSLPASPA